MSSDRSPATARADTTRGRYTADLSTTGGAFGRIIHRLRNSLTETTVANLYSAIQSRAGGVSRWRQQC